MRAAQWLAERTGLEPEKGAPSCAYRGYWPRNPRDSRRAGHGEAGRVGAKVGTLASRLSAWNRDRKWHLFLDQRPSGRILDVGYSAKEYSPVDNYIEKHWPGHTTALGIDPPGQFEYRYPMARAVQYHGGVFPFHSGEFDMCWSNAVLEHVGDRAAQVLFLSEIARVSRRAFITTPNRHFPIEVHTRIPFLHWLPKRWFDAILRRVGKGWAAGDYMHLLSERQLTEMLDEAGIVDYRIIRNRLCGVTLDFVVMW